MSISCNSRSSRSPYGTLLLAAGLVGTALLWPQIGAAQSSSPFAKFSGAWRGSGQVVGTDGNHERITCRATYAVSQNGGALSQTLVCASDSYRVDISSYIVAEGRSVRGHWQEATRQVQGDLTGQIVEGDFEGGVAGPGFTAKISLRATGRRQVVNIRPQGGDVAGVDIVLSRAS
jgi:hypothetical protein